MTKPLRVLIVEDVEDDARLLERELRRAGFDLLAKRVESEETMRSALEEQHWDLVISDYSLPRFSAPAALATLQASGLDLPFIIVSGTIGEDIAVNGMRAGAHDFILKGSLARLAPAVERELEQATQRRGRRQAEEQYHELVANAPIGIYSCTPDGRFISVNQAMVRLLGYDSAEELLRLDPPREIFLESSEHASLVQKLEGPAQTIEARLKRKDGTPIWFELNGRAVLAPSGATARYEVFATDISARRVAEKESFESSPAAPQGRSWRVYWEFPVGALVALLLILVENPLLKMEEAWVDELVIGLTVVAVAGLIFSLRRLKELRAEALERKRVEQALRFLRGDLEGRVEARTADLRKSNEGLQAEIEERRRGEEALRESDEALRSSAERYRLLFDKNPKPMWVFDEKTLAFVAVNEAACRDYGYSREEFLGMTLRDIRPAEDVPALQERIAAESQDHENPSIWRHRTKDGTLIDVEITSDRVIIDGRDAQLVLAIDVTERKRAEAGLQRLAAIVESSNDAIIGTSPAGLIQSWNQGAQLLYGWTADEVLGKPVSLLETPERAGELAGLFSGGRSRPEVLRYESERLRKDGSRVEVSVTLSPIQSASGELVGFASIARDVSEQRGLEQQLRLSQKMEAVGQLAGGIAHDFNNLLTVILGYGSLLASRFAPDASGREEIDEVLRASERAAALTRQLLAFSRLQVLEPIVLSLNDLIVNLEKMLGRLIGEDMNMVTRLDPLLGNVRADPGQLEQVIMNLVVNARDAMPKGGKLTIETANADLDEAYAQRHVTVQPGRYVMIAVSDTGTGMDAETQAHIFEPFFTTKEKGKGTGLGLSTVYGIVKQSGGNIWVYSEPGKGTTFKVYLPRVEEATVEGATLPQASLPATGTETILLVEDDPSIRALAKRVLEERGYRVLEAGGGNEALERHRDEKGPIHLLLTDLIMPDMGGTELATRLQELRPGVRVLFMSGYTDDGVVRNGLLGEGRAFIQKPFTPSVLVRKIRDVLA